MSEIWTVILQNDGNTGYEADDQSMAVSHQGEQDAATATIMASVEQPDTSMFTN